jgi:hypothetical protein
MGEFPQEATTMTVNSDDLASARTALSAALLEQRIQAARRPSRNQKAALLAANLAVASARARIDHALEARAFRGAASPVA